MTRPGRALDLSDLSAPDAVEALAGHCHGADRAEADHRLDLHPRHRRPVREDQPLSRLYVPVPELETPPRHS